MVSLGEELTAEKAETQRLGLYIEQILHEIEDRAPLLKQQREDYERAVAAVGGLTENLESAREEVELRRGEAEEARRRLVGVERDRDRQGQQVTDLGRQVTALVREVEGSRGGGRNAMDTSQPMDSSNVDSVIEGRLLTFRDVAELQERNIELVAVVRELSARQEAQESSLVEEKTAELRQELDTAMRQVEEMRAARERQQHMVENIIQQRDMYKSMATSGGVAPAAATLARPTDAAREEKLVKELEEVKKDFAEYKVEKATNYKMLNDQVEKMREELTVARTKAAKLGSQEEYNTERFKIAAATNESLKRQLGLLEDRNRQLDKIGGQHETSVMALREELMESHQRQSKAEVEADRLRLENSHLSTTNSRLQTEREAIMRDRGTASRIEANMAQIQLNLERREEEGKLRLEVQCEQLRKELELMRKRVDQEQEQFRDSVKAWERTNAELREKVEGAEGREKAAREQMVAQTDTIGTMREELRDAQEQLAVAESRIAGRGLGKQASVTEGQGEGGQESRLRDVELLMAQTKQELKSVNNQLVEAKKRAEEYKGMSEAAERRMVDEETHKVLEESMERISALEVETDKLKEDNEELTKAMATKEERAKLVLKSARTKTQKSEKEKKKLDVELEQIGQDQAAGASEEQDLREKAIMSQLKSVKDDNDKMEGEVSHIQQEKERLLEQVDSVQTDLQAAQLVSFTSSSSWGSLAAPGGPSTCGAPQGGASPLAPTTATTSPTLKRPREQVADSDSQNSTDGWGAARGAVPKMLKKAKSICRMEGLQVMVSRGGEGEEGMLGSREVEWDSSNQVEGEEERRKVGSSSQHLGERVACSWVPTSTQEVEKTLDGEEDEGEEYVVVSENMEEGEMPDDLKHNNIEHVEVNEVDQCQEVEIASDDVAAGTSEEVGEVGGGQEEAGMVEDYSSEPSINTEACHTKSSGQIRVFGAGGALSYEVETGEAGEDCEVETRREVGVFRKGPGSDRWLCGDCGTRFTSERALEQHLVVAGRCQRMKKRSHEVFICPRCMTSYKSRGSWQKHVDFVPDCAVKKKKQQQNADVNSNLPPEILLPAADQVEEQAMSVEEQDTPVEEQGTPVEELRIQVLPVLAQVRVRMVALRLTFISRWWPRITATLQPPL